MADLDTRLLRCFVSVADLRSFTDAAERLHLSQPALSQAIQRLETLVGVPLLKRGRRGAARAAETTRAGEALLPLAREIIAMTDRALQITRTATERTTLNVGFGTSIPRPFTQAVLHAASDLDHEEPILSFIPWGQEITELVSGRLDLVFLQTRHGFSDNRLSLLPVVELQRLAVFPAGHPLAGETGVTLRQLQDEPIIDAASDRDYWIVNPRPHGGAAPAVQPAARSADEMLASVAAGRGMAITSMTVAQRYTSPDLAFVPIDDLHPAMLYLAVHEPERRSEVLAMQSETVARIQALGPLTG